MSQHDPEAERPLRADAERNRRLILETATRMLADRGAAVTLNEIAREAGLGVGTVYRRFADLQSLYDALFIDRFSTFQGLAAAAAREPDAATGLLRYLVEGAEWRAGDPALEHILANARIEHGPIGQMRDALGRAIDELVDRARAAEAVRDDFASADVYNFLFIVGALADRTRDVAPDAWRRYALILLSGFGLHPDPERHSAMTDGELRKAWPRPAPPPTQDS